MTTYTVTQTIQSARTDAGEPFDVRYYSGTDRASALTAMCQASEENDPEWVRLLAVRLDVTRPVIVEMTEGCAECHATSHPTEDCPFNTGVVS